MSRTVNLIVLALIVEMALVAAGIVAWLAWTAGDLNPAHWHRRFPILLVALPVAYEFLMTGWRGQTVGKMTLRLRVIRYADGGRATWQQSAFRALVPAVPQFLALMVPAGDEGARFLLGLVGLWVYASAVFDVLLRGIHDRAAGTIVLRTR